jgi:exopolysaccharide production protein ExoQ
MPSEIAIIIYAIGILWLFRVNESKASKSSSAIWIPVIWTFIGASREVTQWFGGVGSGEMETYLEGSPLDRAIYIALIVCSLVVLFGRGRQAVAFLQVNWPILAFFIYGAISILWSDFPLVAFKRLTKAFGNLLMVLVVLTDPDRPAAIRRFFAYTAFLVIPTSVVLVKYFPEFGRGYNAWTGAAMYTGVSTGKNALGWDCLVFGLATLWRVIEELKARGKAWITKPLFAHGVVLAMALWLLKIASSSAAIGGFIIGSSLMILCGKKWFRMKPLLVHVIVVGIVVICVYGIIIDTDVGLVQAAGRDVTITDRTYLWNDLMRIDINPLIGTGFESFWLGTRVKPMWERFLWHPNQAHNGYIEIYLNLGWMGLLLLEYQILWGYKNAVDALRVEPNFGTLKIPLVVATVILNLTEATFKVMHPVWIVFLLAISIVPRREYERHHVQSNDDVSGKYLGQVLSTRFSNPTEVPACKKGESINNPTPPPR